MADTGADIPDREIFKASEVCEIASLQPYVLRSWEQEFPALGAPRTPGGARLYRRTDVELVLRIKGLVFGEGLTLAGARRRIEEDDEPAGVTVAAPEPAAADNRAALAGIRQELRALLDMLEHKPPASGKSGWPPVPQGTLLEFAREPKPDSPPAAGAPKRGGGKRKPSRQG